MGDVRLSFSCNAFVRYPVSEALKKIAEIGYEGVELLADAPHLYADSLSVADLENLCSVIEKTGLKVANVNANTAMGYYGRDFWEPLFEPSLANPDHDLRQWRLNYSMKCVDLAAFVGSPCVSVTSGRCVAGVQPTSSMALLKKSLAELADYAEKKSVCIGIEYEPGLLVECYDELAQLLEEIKSPSLGANLDLGHSHVLGEDPRKVISSLAGKLFHVHIEDIRGRKHYHLIPGTGDMNFGELLLALKDNHYKGFVTVELYTYTDQPTEAARQSFEFLR
ncbi:MAG: sugar phosphate isomerase/epimerase family protein [Desulfomonilaceae bacterium]